MASARLGAQTTLNFRPIDAKYSNALDRVVMISTQPSLLHIYNPVTNSDSTVGLSKPPIGLAVSPNGLIAAVSHDALITLVNLSTASVVRTYTVPSLPTIQDIVLTADYAYQPGNFSLQLSTGTVTAGQADSVNTRAVLHPAGKVIYGAVNEYFYNVRRYDISNGVLGSARTDSAVYYSTCTPLAFSLDGRRLYDGCGRMSTVATDPLNAPTITATTLGGYPGGNRLYDGFSESSIARRLAVVPVSGISTTTTTGSTTTTTTTYDVRIFDNSTLAQVGRLVMPTFAANGGTFSYKAKWTFFDSQGTTLHTIMQSEPSAGLLNDFAFSSYPLSGSSSCSLSFSPNSVSVPSYGGVVTVAIQSTSPCAYQASYAVPWLQLTAGGFGSGAGSLSFLVRPNSGAARSAGITAGNQILTVYQDGFPYPTPPFQRTPYNITGARYSKSLDRVIFTSANPSELHAYDPLTLSDRFLALDVNAERLAVSPDGFFAMVASGSGLLYIDLRSMTLVRTFFSGSSGGLVVAGNGYAYYGSTSLQLSTGVGTESNTASLGTISALHPSGTSIYSVGVPKLDISQGTARRLAGFPTLNQGSCNYSAGGLWITEDGLRVIDVCGNAYRSSDSPAEDLQQAGKLVLPSSQYYYGTSFIASLADSASRGTIAVTSATNYGNDSPELQLYASRDLSLRGRIALTRFSDTSTSTPAVGRHVFWNAASTYLIAITQPNASSSAPGTTFAFELIPGDLAAGCTVSTPSSVTASGGGGSLYLNVSTGQTCSWNVSTLDGASWISYPSGSSSSSSSSISPTYVGPGQATLALAVNATGTTRTARVSVGGVVVTITQPPIDSIAASPTSFLFPASGGYGTVSVTAPPTMQWNLASNAEWARTTANVYSGSFTFTFSVSANTSSVQRSTTLYVGTQVITITQSGVASAASGSRFVAVAPCRLIDTRANSGFTGQFGAPSLAARTAREFVLPAGRCGLPAGATAYSLNVTVVPKGQLAFLTIWPSGQPQPFVSTLNSFDGRVKANAAIVPAGVNGAVNLWATEETDIVLDVNGYFTTMAPSSETLLFVPANCRLLDTRSVSTTGSATTLLPNQARTLVYSNSCSTLNGARAVMVNVTAIPSGPLAYLTLWPTGSPQPLVSTLNSMKGVPVSNLAIVPLGPSGTIDAFATNTTDLVLDLQGYFAPPNASVSGALFYPLAPCRSVDTRNATGPNGGPVLAANQSRTFPVGGTCGVPAGAVAASTNMTAVPITALGYLSFAPLYPYYGTSNVLTSIDGSVVANAAVSTLNSSSSSTISTVVSVSASDPTHLIIDVNGYFQ